MTGENTEDVSFDYVPGSESAPAHLSHAFRPLRSATLDNPRPTPIGEAALDRIHRLLAENRRKRRPVLEGQRRPWTWSR